MINWTSRRTPSLLIAAGLAGLLLAGVAAAATWGGITPGQTTRREVEARYGRPTRDRQVIEGALAGSEWTYSGERAPSGIERMVIGFGLVRPGGFAPEVVRSLTLFPHPQVFRVLTLTQGWGKPDAIGTDEPTGRPVLRWNAQAILVLLDRSGEYAEQIIFAPGEAQ